MFIPTLSSISHLRNLIYTILLAFSITAHAQVDRTSTGNYQIIYCGSGPGSKAAQLRTLFPQIWDNLQVLKRNTVRGVQSPAYNAFFKTNSSLAAVEEVFRKIADGDTILVPPHEDSPEPFLTWPTLVCISDQLPPGLREDWKGYCNGVNNPFRSTIGTRDEYIFLCDDWFDWPDEPGPPRIACPRLRFNRFRTNDHDVLVGNKYASLIHELAHLYNSQDVVGNEVYGIMDAILLDAQRSLQNANNFALYASSKSPVSCCIQQHK